MFTLETSLKDWAFEGQIYLKTPLLTLKWTIPDLVFFISFFQYRCLIQKFADDWFQTPDFWYQKQPLGQLSDHHFQSSVSFTLLARAGLYRPRYIICTLFLPMYLQVHIMYVYTSIYLSMYVDRYVPTQVSKFQCTVLLEHL